MLGHLDMKTIEEHHAELALLVRKSPETLVTGLQIGFARKKSLWQHANRPRRDRPPRSRFGVISSPNQLAVGVPERARYPKQATA